MLDRVHNDTTAALKAGDKKTAEALRLLYSALKNAQIEAGGALADEKAIAASIISFWFVDRSLRRKRS